MTAGFAVFAFAALGAAPALADEAPEAKQDAGLEAPQTMDAPSEQSFAEVAYTCTSEWGHEDAVTVGWFFETSALDGEAEVGSTLMHGGFFGGLTYWTVDEGGPVTSLSLRGRVRSEGDAAVGPEEHLTATWSGSAEDPFKETEGWDEEGMLGERELTRPGSITYRPAGITVIAEQEDGTSTTTTCTPDSTPAPVLAEVTVIGGDDDGGDGDGDPGDGDGGDGENPGGDDGDGGDDQNPGGDGGDGGGDPGDGDGGDGENPGGDGGDEGDEGGDGGKGDEKPAPGDGSSAGGDDGGSLPVTGAALGGMVAAAVAAVGGGGAAMYFSRKKKAAAASETDA